MISSLAPSGDRPRRLELGCGDRPTPGYLHQDITALPGVTLDYTCPPWEIPLPDASLDEVLALGLVEHLRFAEVRATLARVSALLVPGGSFLFDVPDMRVWSEYLYHVTHGQPELVPFEPEHVWSTIYGWQRWPGDEHKSGWTREGILDAVRNAGFTDHEEGSGSSCPGATRGAASAARRTRTSTCAPSSEAAMQCVILAGGRATRLGERADRVPKHLLPVGGRPFAQLQLARLRELGVLRVVYCLGHLGPAIRDFVGDGSRYDLVVRYVDERESARGTAGALRLALEEGALEDSFFVTYGDSLLRADLASMRDTFAGTDAAAMMSVFHNAGRLDVSNVAYADGRVLVYDKGTPPGTPGVEWIDYGLTLWRRSAASSVLPEESGDLAPVLSGLARSGRLAGFAVRERFFEIGSPAGLAELDALLAPAAEAAGERPLVILDRDGVLNAMVVDAEHGTIDSPLHPSQVLLLPGVAGALRELGELGFDLAIASNQPAAAKGKTHHDNLERVHALVVALAEAEGGHIRSSHICFHRREDGCACRKPAPGLLDAALAPLPPDLRVRSWMVGDGLTDLEAGRRAGLRSALIAPDKLDLRAMVERAGARPDFWGEDLASFVGHLRAEGGDR